MIATDFMLYANNRLKGTEAASHLTWLEEECRTQGAESTEEQALPHHLKGFPLLLECGIQDRE